jgi:hypothetical protein
VPLSKAIADPAPVIAKPVPGSETVPRYRWQAVGATYDHLACGAGKSG